MYTPSMVVIKGELLGNTDFLKNNFFAFLVEKERPKGFS